MHLGFQSYFQLLLKKLKEEERSQGPMLGGVHTGLRASFSGGLTVSKGPHPSPPTCPAGLSLIQMQKAKTLVSPRAFGPLSCHLGPVVSILRSVLECFRGHLCNRPGAHAEGGKASLLATVLLGAQHMGDSDPCRCPLESPRAPPRSQSSAPRSPLL